MTSHDVDVTSFADIATALRGAVRGIVAGPADPAYRSLVDGFHQAFAHTPPIAVRPVDAEDVVAVVSVARRAGFPVTALGEGHGFHYGISDGILLQTRGLASVEIDAAAATARIGAGTRWQEVVAAAEPVGLTPLAGSDAGVGAVGYVLGGGLGPLGRTYGYAADSVVSFDVVTGEGVLVTVDDEHHPQLFWALRGGNHGLGIVTAMTVRLVAAEHINGNAWYYEGTDIETMLRAWARWSVRLPDEMNSYAHIVRMPDDPDLPQELRGKTLLELIHVYVGDARDGSSLVAPLLELAQPVFHEPGRVREETLPPMVVSDGGVYLDDLDDAAIDAILDLAGPQHPYAQVPLVSVGLQLLGGALATARSSANAVTGRDAAYAFHVIGAEPDVIDTVIPEQIRTLHRAVARLHSAGTIPNYIGPSNDPGAVDCAWPDAMAQRLREIRRRYDPDGILALSHTN
ncbi:FAD-binding oxidoreductase [Gordonia aichiensis]|uniref:Putative oxidoreductase n=1 Tax=Gordonia aichiensis NBRC 108223 TaxID=1220583 RepID=L7KPF2_9ACTN|nr:FAD-binding protein [Gordonia aichiensis]GAC50745.1 putative oxidoreductase [Gordonia aichiensis NBRC 108223]